MTVRRATWATVLLTLVLAGCGADDEPSGDGRTTTATATTPTPTATTPGTVTQAAAPAEGQRIGDCLKLEGYRVQGGAPEVDATNAPEYQIIFSGPRGGGYIGFYKNVSRAKRVATRLRKNAQRTSGAAAERHGAINIVWVDLPGAAARERVRDCLVT